MQNIKRRISRRIKNKKGGTFALIRASFPNKMTDNKDVYKSESASQIAAVKATFATLTEPWLDFTQTGSHLKNVFFSLLFFFKQALWSQ